MEVTATTKVGMATREVTAIREGMAKTKVAMEGVMVMIKVDMGDMIMVAGITTRTEAVVAVGEEEATGDTVAEVDMVQAGLAQPAPSTGAPAMAAAAAAVHVALKIPSGGGPYARAKHYQKDLDASIAWFWKAIETGDKVDSALKDMAVVMKQRGYLDDAVDAIRSLRHLCPGKQSQESLDNILLDLYKASGRTKEEIELLKHKLRRIYHGQAFPAGKATKRARSHGRKIHVSVQQETSRVLGNLAWAYMQQRNFMAAEAVYRKAQMVEPDANKACNLALCLMEQGRLGDAEGVLADGVAGATGGGGEKEAGEEDGAEADEMAELLDMVARQWAAPYRKSHRRLPVFEEITPFGREQMAC
ncbi:hypothetical protein TRIUR3_26027 [Triticum urartu]|uniref:Protein SULFUR DEFICIENCY-INDUCED 1 n=1 Tax=Triticum urartu TaxID=4572 RepID=M7ZC55_TRIUA|nr:hypothetical protein TRIUR3_26027 [Triticum urartu]